MRRGLTIWAVAVGVAFAGDVRAICGPSFGVATSSTEYDGPGSGTDTGWAMVVDASGSVYVAGIETGGSGGNNWRVRKYDAALSRLLATTDYDGPAHAGDGANGLAIDGSGHVYVVGYESTLAGTWSWRIREYDPELTTLLSTTDYVAPAAGSADAYAVAIDAASGDVLVAGYETGLAGGLNWRLRRYAPSLTTLLAATDYDGPGSGSDYATGIAVDHAGDILAIGDEYAGAGGLDWRLRRYDPTLSVLLAATRYDGPGDGDDAPNAVVVNVAGDVIVAGHETGSAGGLNWRIRRYDATLATLLATTEYGGAGGGLDDARGLAADGAGDVVVAGVEDAGGGDPDWRIRLYDPTLAVLLATTSYADAAGGADEANAAAFDPSGGVVVAGTETGAAGGVNWLVRRYACPAALPPASVVTPPVLSGDGSIRAYPNPVAGDAVVLALALPADADVVTADVFNYAMNRVYHGEWRGVARSPGTLTLRGLGRWGRGVYLVRVKARWGDGTTRSFPVCRVMVTR